AMADRLAADIFHGVAGTAIRAGILLHCLHDASREQAIAAAAAQRRTGALLLLRTEGGEPDAAVAHMADAGVTPERIMVVASARRSGEQALRAVLARGAGVAMVDLLADGWEAAARHAAVVVSLADSGFGDRIVLGSGLTRRARPRASGGGPGWSGMVERFPLLLMEAGLGAVAVRALLVDNPRRALTIEPPAGNEGTA
ncbi:MAG TPA: hypothetical protein VFU81_16525, partial [Thermomicrobiales bacterium]|nr:hypothetical protein [Thermomicrobiales bacterium]